LGNRISLGETLMFCAYNAVQDNKAGKRKPVRLFCLEITGTPWEGAIHVSGMRSFCLAQQSVRSYPVEMRMVPG